MKHILLLTLLLCVAEHPDSTANNGRVLRTGTQAKDWLLQNELSTECLKQFDFSQMYGSNGELTEHGRKRIAMGNSSTGRGRGRGLLNCNMLVLRNMLGLALLSGSNLCTYRSFLASCSLLPRILLCWAGKRRGGRIMPRKVKKQKGAGGGAVQVSNHPLSKCVQIVYELTLHKDAHWFRRPVQVLTCIRC